MASGSSPAFALYTTHRRSGLIDTYSTMASPAVSFSGSPPVAGTE